MRASIIAAAVLLSALAVPAGHDSLPFAGVTVSASMLQQESGGQPQESRPADQPTSAPSQPAAQPAPQPTPDAPAPQVNVQVSNPSWYASPTWLAIGAIALVVLILVVVMATRTGSNTVIRG